jgi:hypothetical protein
VDSYGTDFVEDFFNGGVVVGNVCFVAAPADAGAMQILGSAGFTGRDVFLDASASPESVEPMTTLRGNHPGTTAADSRLAPTFGFQRVAAKNRRHLAQRRNRRRRFRYSVFSGRLPKSSTTYVVGVEPNESCNVSRVRFLEFPRPRSHREFGWP